MEQAIKSTTYYLDKPTSTPLGLRNQLIDTLKPRGHKIDLAVCISICNEKYSSFLKSLKCIMKNVSLLCQHFQNILPSNVVIFLIQDGYEKVSPDFLSDAHRKITIKERFYAIQEQTNEKSLAGQNNTFNQKFRDDESWITSDRNFADMEMSHISGFTAQEGSPSSVDPPNGGGQVIPMTNYAVTKWNESQLLHCFYTLTSLNLFVHREDRIQINKVCLGDIPEMWLVYGVKESNRGKLDSHRFFFQGFCRDLNPRYCILTDCGTQFRNNTYYGFIQLGEIRPLLAGICSEIQSEWKCTPLVMAQYVEYKIDQILKTAEGLYGLVQILPGAHQFLKWSAVRGKPLQIYCEGTEEHNYSPHKDTLGIFKRNVFLTQDKLMTTLLMTREDQLHTIQYLPGARSYTDVPKSTVAILRQRRRWLNGGFSCTIYGLCLYCKDYKNSKMKKKKPCLGCLLLLQLFYYVMQIFVQSNIAFDICTYYFLIVPFQNLLRGHPFDRPFSWANNSALFIIFLLLTLIVFFFSLLSNTRKKPIIIIFQVLRWVFVVMNILKYLAIFVIFQKAFSNQILPLNLTPQNGQVLVSQTIFAILSIISITMSFVTLFLIKPKNFCKNMHRYFLGFFFYLLEYNTFFYMVKIYMICNYHDVTWGSRHFLQHKDSSIRNKYRKHNLLLLAFWIAAHALMIFTLVFMPWSSFILYVILFIMIGQNLLRCVESIIYWWCKYYCYQRYRLYGSYVEIEGESFELPREASQRAEELRLAKTGGNFKRLQFLQSHSSQSVVNQYDSSSQNSDNSLRHQVNISLDTGPMNPPPPPPLKSGRKGSVSSRKTGSTAEKLGSIKQEDQDVDNDISFRINNIKGVGAETEPEMDGIDQGNEGDQKRKMNNKASQISAAGFKFGEQSLWGAESSLIQSKKGTSVMDDRLGGGLGFSKVSSIMHQSKLEDRSKSKTPSYPGGTPTPDEEDSRGTQNQYGENSWERESPATQENQNTRELKKSLPLPKPANPDDVKLNFVGGTLWKGPSKRDKQSQLSSLNTSQNQDASNMSKLNFQGSLGDASKIEGYSEDEESFTRERSKPDINIQRVTTKKVKKEQPEDQGLDLSRSRLDLGGGSLWGRDSQLVNSRMLESNKSLGGHGAGFDLSGANLWKGEGSEAGSSVPSSNLDKSKISKSEMSRLQFQSGSLWGGGSSVIQSNASELESKGSLIESGNKKSKISSFAHSSVLSRHPPDHNKITEESEDGKEEDDMEESKEGDDRSRSLSKSQIAKGAMSKLDFKGASIFGKDSSIAEPNSFAKSSKVSSSNNLDFVGDSYWGKDSSMVNSEMLQSRDESSLMRGTTQQKTTSNEVNSNQQIQFVEGMDGGNSSLGKSPNFSGFSHLQSSKAKEDYGFSQIGGKFSAVQRGTQGQQSSGFLGRSSRDNSRDERSPISGQEEQQIQERKSETESAKSSHKSISSKDKSEDQKNDFALDSEQDSSSNQISLSRPSGTSPLQPSSEGWTYKQSESKSDSLGQYV